MTSESDGIAAGEFSLPTVVILSVQARSDECLRGLFGRTDVTCFDLIPICSLQPSRCEIESENEVQLHF